MNISEANATAHLLRGQATTEEQQFLAEKAGKALKLSAAGILRRSYCRAHGVRSDECGCA